MSSINRLRSAVMGSSFAKWNLLQAAVPSFRNEPYLERRVGEMFQDCGWLSGQRQMFRPLPLPRQRFSPIGTYAPLLYGAHRLFCLSARVVIDHTDCDFLAADPFANRLEVQGI